jgi:hypothetical protein
LRPGRSFRSSIMAEEPTDKSNSNKQCKITPIAFIGKKRIVAPPTVPPSPPQ